MVPVLLAAGLVAGLVAASAGLANAARQAATDAAGRMRLRIFKNRSSSCG
jgi:hypothetical protein